MRQFLLRDMMIIMIPVFGIITLLKSTQTILNFATECFFRQGYNATNIATISRLAGISRVTIHKQFSSKKDLFRSVVVNHFTQQKQFVIEYSQSDADFWQDTESLLLNRCEGAFDGVTSALTRSELIHCAQAYCKDIIDQEEIAEVKLIEERLLKEIKENRISINKLNMSTFDFARLIESIPKGIAVSSFESESQVFIAHSLRLFKLATAA